MDERVVESATISTEAWHWSAVSHREPTFTRDPVAAAALVRAGQDGADCVDRLLLVGSTDDRSADTRRWQHKGAASSIGCVGAQTGFSAQTCPMSVASFVLPPPCARLV